MDGAVYESIILPFVIFVIASALSSVLNVLSIVSNLMGTATSSLSASSERLVNQGIDKFDGQLVSGSTVIGAVKDFGSQSMAVLIQNGTGNGGEKTDWFAYAYLLKGSTSESGKGDSANEFRIAKGSTELKKTDDSPYYTAERLMEDGVQKATFEERSLRNKTSERYVTPYATYFARLIRDKRGLVIGAAFEEQ